MLERLSQVFVGVDVEEGVDGLGLPFHLLTTDPRGEALKRALFARQITTDMIERGRSPQSADRMRMPSAARNRAATLPDFRQQSIEQIPWQKRHVSRNGKDEFAARLHAEKERRNKTTKRTRYIGCVDDDGRVQRRDLSSRAHADYNKIRPGPCSAQRAIDEAFAAEAPQRLAAADTPAFPASEDHHRDLAAHVKSNFVPAMVTSQGRGRRSTPSQVPRKAPPITEASKIGSSCGNSLKRWLQQAVPTCPDRRSGSN